MHGIRVAQFTFIQRSAGVVELALGMFTNFSRWQHQFTGCLRGQLDFAGFFQVVHAQKRLPHGFANGQQAMVAQHQHRLVAQVLHQPLLLAHVQRHAFIVVIGNPTVKLHGNLIHRQQAALQRGHRAAGFCVGMQHALRIFTGAMNRAVNHKTGRVHREWRRLNGLTTEVDFHQIGRGDFLKHQPIGIDQKMMFRAGNTYRNVGENQIGHAVMRNQAITGGQLFTQALFGSAALGRGSQVGLDFVHCFNPPDGSAGQTVRLDVQGRPATGGYLLAQALKRSSSSSPWSTQKPTSIDNAPLRFCGAVGTHCASLSSRRAAASVLVGP